MVKYEELYKKAKQEMYDRWEDGKPAWKAEAYEPQLSEAPRIDEVIERFATIPLVYNENNKISAIQTFNQLKEADEELFYLLLFMSAYPRRAGIILDGERYCSLVPPLMSAHKEFHDVMYEDWDKKDKGISLAVGLTLWHDIKNYLVPIKDLDNKLADLRKPNMFVKSGTNKGNPKNLLSNAWANMRYGEGKWIPGKSLTLCIKGQFWKANVKARNKYMILDTTNWDNIPKAFDEYHEESKEQKGKVNKTVQKSMIDLPF